MVKGAILNVYVTCILTSPYYLPTANRILVNYIERVSSVIPFVSSC